MGLHVEPGHFEKHAMMEQPLWQSGDGRFARSPVFEPHSGFRRNQGVNEITIETVYLGDGGRTLSAIGVGFAHSRCQPRYIPRTA